MNNEELMNIVKSILTVEQKEALELALAEKANAEAEITDEDFIIDEDFGKVRKMTIAEIKKEFGPSKSKTGAPFGVTKQLDKKGQEFNYIRKEFDGKEQELDEVHKNMKQYFIMFSKFLIKAVPSFNGAGDYAITMYEPQSQYANKDGKVFYRWDNPQRTQPLMDKLYPLIEGLVLAVEDVGEE